MESEIVRRRMNMIAAHFASNEDISPTHIFPMNCSNSLNYVGPRYDNRMHFARQCSASQAFFMKQISTQQQGSSEKTEMPLNCSTSDGPMYSRARIMEPKSSIKSSKNGCNSFMSCDIPSFARPSKRAARQSQSQSQNQISSSSRSNGKDWSPKMDVAESGRSYVVTVEIPGVNVDDIRIEVNDQNLTILGKRSSSCWKAKRCEKDSISAYHKREILQGPYQVVWPLPSNVNKDNISAEFLAGILQIVIPKLRDQI